MSYTISEKIIEWWWVPDRANLSKFVHINGHTLYDIDKDEYLCIVSQLYAQEHYKEAL